MLFFVKVEQIAIDMPRILPVVSPGGTVPYLQDRVQYASWILQEGELLYRCLHLLERF